MKLSFCDSRGASSRLASRILSDRRHVIPLQGTRLGARRLAQQADLFERARLRHDEVVRHDVAVLEDDLDRLAGLGGDPILVEEHLVGDRAQADHPHAQVAQLAAGRRRLVGRAAARQRVAELDRVERGRPRSGPVPGSS